MTADETSVILPAPKRRRAPAKVRGVFERRKGSDIWWVRHTDCSGREHREKASTRGMAIALLDKRRMERRQGIKMPETIRREGTAARDRLDLAAAHVADH